MNCALCIELTLFGCKFTQKIRISILFSKKSHIHHLFFIEIQHKTHPIRNTQNMHIFLKSVQSNKSKSTKNTCFFLKLPKSTTFIHVGTHGSCIRPPPLSEVSIKKKQPTPRFMSWSFLFNLHLIH